MDNYKNKMAGPMGVTNEMIKYATDTRVMSIIAIIITTVINYNVKPKSWNIGLVVTIIKDAKGDNTKVDNSRGLTISDVLAIIWEYYILAQFEIKSDLQDQQFGFRKCSSTTHAIYTLRELIRLRKRSKLDTYVLFLDFSKAFDKIHRIKLMVKLNRYFHPKLWLAIANYYSISSIRIMDKNKNIIGEIKTKSGVKQGGPFRQPALMHTLMNSLK